jgi:hypothetical protein
MLGTALVWMGCTGSDGDGSAEMIGSSTIMGTVESFEGSSEATGRVGVYTGGVREGIQVRVMETDLSTTTADDGLFVISGVPAGPRTLRFEYRGEAAPYRLDVPEQAELVMNRIRIRNREVTCDPVVVRPGPPAEAPNRQAGGEGVLDRDRIRLSQQA